MSDTADKPRGRRVISHEDIAAVIDMMAEGHDLKEASALKGIDYSTVRKHRDASPELTALYARARADYARCRVEEIHSIAKTELDVQRARLMIDCIKWDVSKVLPKEFGDKLTLDGELTQNVKVTVKTPEQVDQALFGILGADWSKT